MKPPDRQVAELKPLVFVGRSQADLQSFPKEVRVVAGHALHIAQQGGKHSSAKPLKGFKGAGVLEIVDDFDGDTYRAVYTVRLAGRVYVLHAFQKKAKKGIATPKAEMELVEARLKRAVELHAGWLTTQKKDSE